MRTKNEVVLGDFADPERNCGYPTQYRKRKMYSIPVPKLLNRDKSSVSDEIPRSGSVA
jgi:hypothetical protein